MTGLALREASLRAAVSSPAWSPDGDSIAFETVSTQGEAEIHVVHPDGSGRRRLTLGSNPAFRPR